MKAIYVCINTFQNESRILKQTTSMLESGVADQVTILADWQPGLAEQEIIDTNRILLRFKPKWSLRLWIPGAYTAEYEKRFRTALYLITSKPKFVSLHSVYLLPYISMVRFFNKQVKWIYDAHELETEVAGLNNNPQEKIRLKEIESKYITKVDHTFVVSPSIEKWYRNTYNIAKISTLLNCPYAMPIAKGTKFRDRFNIGQDSNIFLYQGALFKGRGIEVLLAAFKAINDPKYAIVFMGYGELEEEIKTAGKQFHNIHFHEAVKPDIVLEYTASADYGISLIENICMSYSFCLPNKIFEYMMAGLPCIVSNLKDMSDYINEYQVGVIAEEMTPESLEKSIYKLASLEKEQLLDKINTARKAINWQVEEEKMVRVYKQLLSS